MPSSYPASGALHAYAQSSFPRALPGRSPVAVPGAARSMGKASSVGAPAPSPPLLPLRSRLPQVSTPSRHAPARVLLPPCRAKMPQAGRYGGPPDRNVRKITLGPRRPDPLSSGDYLWDNKAEWQRMLDQERREQQQREEEKEKEEEGTSSSSSPSTSSGFLSLSRSLALDSMDVDLSRELTSGATSSLEDQVAEARRRMGELAAPASDAAGAQEGQPVVKWKAVGPSSRERKKKDKSNYVPRSDGDGPSADSEEHYRELKKSLLLYTAVLGVSSSTFAALFYSQQVAVSLTLGCVGSFVYARMLSSSVESVGKSGLQAAAKGSLGQPRLLVPVVLVLVFNRWNTILVPEYGFVELQLVPMLLGLFTYKAATIIRTFQDLLPSPSPPPGPSQDAVNEGAGGGGVPLPPASKESQ